MAAPGDLVSLRHLFMCCLPSVAPERQPLNSTDKRRRSQGDLPLVQTSYRTLQQTDNNNVIRRRSVGEKYALMMSEILPPITEYAEPGKENEGKHAVVYVMFCCLAGKV